MNSSAFADRLYVDGTNGICGGDGSDWGSDAFKYLKLAIIVASIPELEIDEIWVAAGTYYPDQDCGNTHGNKDWNATFNMVDGVAILGGFEGMEEFAEDRDPVTNVTILSGNIGAPASGCGEGGDCHLPNNTPGCDNSVCCDFVCDIDPECCTIAWDIDCYIQAESLCNTFDNSFNILTAHGIGSTAILDGFTVTGGRGFTTQELHGGGLDIVNASPTIVRCKFIDNQATVGGGIAVFGGAGTTDPLIINCEFNDNAANCYGAGIVVYGNAAATVVNSTFTENVISGVYPGAGFAVTTSDASGMLINCVFVGNYGIISGGGGVAAKGGSIVMNSCILWDNDPNQVDIVPTTGATLVVNYSDIQDQGDWPYGVYNIDVDPLFVDLAGGDYHLQPASLCIDTGNPDDDIITDDFFDLDNDGSTSEPTPDLDLNNRISSPDDECQVVDMGAYEFVQGCCQWDLDDNDMVSTSDLLTLFAEWGIHDPGPPDFDCDGDVDTNDLLALFANWGRCECAPPGPEPLSFEDELIDACLTQADWDAFEDVMRDPLSPQSKKDRYQCWMEHYINDCNKCTCFGPVPCPNPDPYN
ncbi:MAG: right-handed parallel beta-helix repeat-containing protein [Planctomycetes bacterium]|nr:right-handed parallel beta-helix repeat-containing protein [Planctomycetota bacterium]